MNGLLNVQIEKVETEVAVLKAETSAIQQQLVKLDQSLREKISSIVAKEGGLSELKEVRKQMEEQDG